MDDIIALDADILVIGGGMAACWAAIGAARAGADVLLVDKGFVGTSGVTATGGPNHWWVPPDPALRRDAIQKRMAMAHGLADPDCMARIIETTWALLPTLAPFYPFAGDGKGGTFYAGVRGPEYLRALRQQATALGVRILDHHPALELLLDADGAVAGAAGDARLLRRPWRARAGAVVLATGGCAFRSGLLGSHGNTGDGLLMAAEAGAELSGMEFSVAYSLSPAWNSTRTLPYFAARFFDEGGREIDLPPPLTGNAHLRGLAAAMLAGPVYADLGDAPADLKPILRAIQPATLTPFERKGVDIFADRFAVKLFGEGTVRGTGGLRVVDGECRTGVPGLFAAGDVATREPIAGATSGGGAQNSAWALTSGDIAGRAAAAHAQGRRRDGPASAIGRAGLRPAVAERPIDAGAILAAVQHDTIGYEAALWRNAPALARAGDRLDAAWRDVRDHAAGSGPERLAARELAAMIAAARWSTVAAAARTESRGMHNRVDAPAPSPLQAHRLILDGIDDIGIRPDTGSLASIAA